MGNSKTDKKAEPKPAPKQPPKQAEEQAPTNVRPGVPRTTIADQKPDAVEQAHVDETGPSVSSRI